MSKDLDGDPLSPEWVCALAIRLINLGWFRVGTERYARTTRTYGDHDAAQVRTCACGGAGSRSATAASTASWCAPRSSTRSSLTQCASCSGSPGRRLFRYELPTATFSQPHRRAAERLHRRVHGRRILRQGLPDLGRDADRCDCPRRARSRGDGNARQKNVIAGVMRAVGESSGIRRPLREPPMSGRRSSSSISTDERSTISGRAICASWAREIRARSRRAGDSSLAAFVANSPRANCRVNSSRLSDNLPRSLDLKRRTIRWPERPCSSATTAVMKSGEGKGATLRLTYTDARRGAKQADLCDDCAGQMPGHAAAGVDGDRSPPPPRRSSALFHVPPRPKRARSRRDPGLRWIRLRAAV